MNIYSAQSIFENTLAVVQEEELFMNKLIHTSYRIGNIEIPNRIVKSAMFEYCAN